MVINKRFKNKVLQYNNIDRKYSEELCKIQQRVLEVSEMSNSVISENEQLKIQLKQIYSMYNSDKQYDEEMIGMKQSLLTKRRSEMQKLSDTVDTLYQAGINKRKSSRL
jgi:hypothetical protein